MLEVQKFMGFAHHLLIYFGITLWIALVAVTRTIGKPQLEQGRQIIFWRGRNERLVLLIGAFIILFAHLVLKYFGSIGAVQGRNAHGQF